MGTKFDGAGIDITRRVVTAAERNPDTAPEFNWPGFLTVVSMVGVVAFSAGLGIGRNEKKAAAALESDAVVGEIGMDCIVPARGLDIIVGHGVRVEIPAGQVPPRDDPRGRLIWAMYDNNWCKGGSAPKP